MPGSLAWPAEVALLAQRHPNLPAELAAGGGLLAQAGGLAASLTESMRHPVHCQMHCPSLWQFRYQRAE